ncbi:uncharacterized protein LOC132795915 [Drosophila nasuta]|uniref:uncharacterized protein LOC132795915 n=1 Tax=Drosophila nasuta TaxID=42062 RepID=UPI00295EB737|nr:uncharacterized protein LOC132795915 [Drosophila nasuta]
MKVKQKPTAAATATTVAGVSVAGKQRSKVEETTARPRLATGTQCERERKHEAARKEREAQAQLKRTATSTSTVTQAAQTKAKPMRRSASASKATVRERQTTAKSAAAAAAGSPASNEEEAAQLRLQLEHLAQLSQQDFEREFRKWMAQEGIEGKVQAQVRMDLINSFNSTSLGKLLRKASASACGMPRTPFEFKSQEQPAVDCVPMTLALHTLVAEFLYAHNCHYTLSVYCSELPPRHTLPDFESRTAFRFTPEELQQLLADMLGGGEQHEQLCQTLLRLYDEQQISLLRGCFQVLVEAQQRAVNSTFTSSPLEQRTTMTQTLPTACLPTQPNVDTSTLFPAGELVIADSDARSVFIGARVSKSLLGVEQQLGQLMHNMDKLWKSCAPPVEIISQSAFEQLVQRELLERQRLHSVGQTLEPGQTALQLPQSQLQPQQQQSKELVDAGNTVQSPAGPIQLPAEAASVPKLPQLHSEQLASLAMVQQALQQLQQQLQQPQQSMQLTLDRMETLVGELAGCIQTLSNVLNLAMEQEYAVGRHKGFKLGYREGFAHGHFMGLQEGMQSAERQQQQQKVEEPKPPSPSPPPCPQLKDSSSQTPQPPTPVKVSKRSVASQTPHKRQRHRATSMERRLEALQRHVASQTAAGYHEGRSYEQWIYEMLHSSSGQIFLERVELSLNKALELQKKRLDELFNVKLRHHAEMMRLNSRQSSWRTLCRHVERDSQSMEARDLVHKIFRLLEHYDHHHQLLAEKIQQTEKAAEQAARIEPVWKDASARVTACNVTPASTATKSTPTVAEAASLATAASMPKSLQAASMASSLPPTSSHQFAAIPDALPTTLPAVEPTTFPAAAEAASNVSAFPAAAESAPNVAPASLPSLVASSLPGFVPAPLPSVIPAALPGPLASHLQAFPAASAPAPPMTMPTLFTHFLLPFAAPATEPAATAPTVAAAASESSGRPLMHNVSTNTQRATKERPQPAPSFNEALLSAKNRMLQLEQESDLLEQSFLGYLERARTQKQKVHISAGCALEQQQLHRTLDNFREWQLRMRREDASATVAAAVPTPTQGQPVVISPIYSGSELDTDSYQFTNAIAVARHKLLSELHATAEPRPPAATAEIVSSNNRLLVDQVQDETQELLSRVEATLARVSKPASLQLLTAESQMPLEDPLEALSSNTHSSLEQIAAITTPPASRKLQRSMAKMQLLFGKQQTTTTNLKRPWSAPIVQLNPTQLATRPHTAPSSLTDAPAGAGAGGDNLLGLLDALSDVGSSTGNSSSSNLISGLGRKSPVAFGGISTASHASSSAGTLSPSQEFWKRMNM